MKKLLFYISLSSSVISFLTCLLCDENIDQAYFLIALYPLLYGLLSLLLWPYMSDRSCTTRITAGTFLVLQWLRCVLLPMLGAISGYFTTENRFVDEASALSAGWLFVYEIVLTFLAVYLILRFSRKQSLRQNEPNAPLQELSGLRGRVFVYVVFVLFALFLYLREGDGMYTFFLLDTTSTRASAIESTISVTTSALIGFGLTFAVILSVYYCFRRYTATGLSRYVYLALLIALLRISLISSTSEGRLAILYPTGAFLLLLPKLFRKHSRFIIRSILITGGAVIALMTIYKVFRAFAYDSYAEALQSGLEDFGTGDSASQIDVYFYGVHNIARNIYVSQRMTLPANTFFSDLVRNTFGLHYLVKDSTQTTVELYNLFIYNGSQSSGHLYSSLSYGYTYWGAFLAPFATVINIWFASLLEKLLRKTKYIDTFYIVSIVYARMVYMMFACFPLGWNNASRNLILGFLVIGSASLLKNHWGSSGKTYRTLRSI